MSKLSDDDIANLIGVNDDDSEGSDLDVVEAIDPNSDMDIDDTDTEDNPDLDWTDDEKDLENFNFSGIPMYTFPGNVNFENLSSKNIFGLFFNDEILDLIIMETNEYAEKAARPFKKTDRQRFWTPLNREELDRFFGTVILMGLWKLPNIQNYWNKKGIYKNSIFPEIMSRNRFQLILKNLHFTKLDAATTGDTLAKIRPILDLLRRKFTENRYPEKELSLDESMIAWRGRLKCRQYIKNKRHKYGIKLYKICCKDGYVLGFLPYAGKETTPGDAPKTEQIVFKLMEPYLKKGHVLFMDNFYNSVPLTQKLYDHQTHVVGTLNKKKKKNPKVVISKKLKKGESISRRLGNIVVSKWKDKKEVLMISSKHKHRMVETTNKRKQKKLKPLCIKDYNDFMGGVDLSDQISSYSSMSRRSLKWYKRAFFYLMDTAISNSFIFAKNTLPEFEKFSIVDFKESLVRDLIPDLGTEKNENTSKCKQHYFEVLPSTQKIKSPCKRCEVCKRNNVRKESRYFCPVCPSKPVLCVVPCFKEWHTN